jgi:hypothetical protein
MLLLFLTLALILFCNSLIGLIVLSINTKYKLTSPNLFWFTLGSFVAVILYLVLYSEFCTFKTHDSEKISNHLKAVLVDLFISDVLGGFIAIYFVFRFKTK